MDFSRSFRFQHAARPPSEDSRVKAVVRVQELEFIRTRGAFPGAFQRRKTGKNLHKQGVLRCFKYVLRRLEASEAALKGLVQQ